MSDALREKLEEMKREIAALQAANQERLNPWYTNISVLVSVVALLFSFGTTFVSYHHTAVQDVGSSRQELRGLLQRLAALPRDSVENTKKYAGDGAALALVSGFLNQENTVLARSAVEIAKKLPKDAISPMDYYAIGVALQYAYDLRGAEEFYNYALDSNPDFNTEIAILRGIANLQFIQGHPAAGRVEYQKALDIFSKYPEFDSYTKAYTNILTELNWGYSEAGGNAFADAVQHVDSADRIVADLPHSPGGESLRLQIAQERAVIESTSKGRGTTPALFTTVPVPPPSR